MDKIMLKNLISLLYNYTDIYPEKVSFKHFEKVQNDLKIHIFNRIIRHSTIIKNNAVRVKF